MGLQLVPALGATCFLCVCTTVALSVVITVPNVRVAQFMATAPPEAGLLFAKRALAANRRENALVRLAED
jgi:hypothetical protein